MNTLTLALMALMLGNEADKEAEVLALIRTAHEQHAADCSSGRMQFRRHNVTGGGSQVAHMEGDVEWDEGYLYFNGQYQEQWKGKVEGTFEMDIDCTQQFLRSDDDAVAWQKLKKSDAPEGIEHAVRLFPFSRLNRTPQVRTIPDPNVILVSRDGSSPGSALELVQEKPITLKGVSFERSVTIEGAMVTVKCIFKPNVEQVAQFDLSIGAMCVATRDVFHYKDPVMIRTSRRKFTKSTEGIWYPSETSKDSRDGSDSADPTFIGLLEVLKFEPLGERTMNVNAGLDSFGELPTGTYVTEMDSAGKSHTYDLGGEPEQDPEQILKEQAKGLRGKGLNKEKQ